MRKTYEKYLDLASYSHDAFLSEAPTAAPPFLRWRTSGCKSPPDNESGRPAGAAA